MSRQDRPYYSKYEKARDGTFRRHEPQPTFRNTSDSRNFRVDRSPGRQISLLTNAYPLRATKTNIIIYEYKLSINPTDQCRNLPSKVFTRTFVSRSIRQIIMHTIIPQLIESSWSPGSISVDPHMDVIYSTKPLKLKAAGTLSNHQEFMFENLAVLTDLIANLSVDIMIKFTTSYTIDPLGYSPQLLSSIIHHQVLIDMLKFGPVYYMPNEHEQTSSTSRHGPQRLDLLSQHLTGISLSNAKRCSDDLSFVVISCSHSYITKSYRLIDLLLSFIVGNDPTPGDVALDHSVGSSEGRLASAQIKELASIGGQEDWFGSFCAILNGFKCQSRNMRGDLTNLRFSLTDQPAAQLMIDTKTSVQQYYYKHGIRLNYPNLPCLQSRSPHQAYYPLEMCSLLSGQKVPIFRLSYAARNHLVNLNKPKPPFYMSSSSRARDDVARINVDQFKSFGVELSRSPLEATGLTLAKPMLQFSRSFFKPSQDYWESGLFQEAVNLIDNWCVIDTVGLGPAPLDSFFSNFSDSSRRFGLIIGRPCYLVRYKSDIETDGGLETLINECSNKVRGTLRLMLFIIDSGATPLNRLIHLTFDEHPSLTATCLRAENVRNPKIHRSIYRTLVHKLNARLGGTNVVYNEQTWHQLNIDSRDLMIVGLDVTHPDNELNGVSIVGCAYTYGQDLFRHRSLVWPQGARVEIISNMSTLMKRLLSEYKSENRGKLPANIVVYRDGVSHEEFDKVRDAEISKAISIIHSETKEHQVKPVLSYIIAQKRHMMRFFQAGPGGRVQNPPSGTLIDTGVVATSGCEFYLYTNTSPQATARPLHYHVLLNGLGIGNIQKLTYYLCFNFAKCSSSLSMPSSLRYAHNAAYDARNRVIAAKEFRENKFYTTKFFY